MKRYIAALMMCLMLGVNAWSADEKPVPVMPNEVTLTTGRVLRNVQVVRWERDRVVLKYIGGIDPIAFSLVAEPLRSQLSAIREGSVKIKAPMNRSVGGQVFITTAGAGTYKFGGTLVLVLPLAAMDSIKSSVESELATARAQKGTFATQDEGPIRYRAWATAVKNFTSIASTTTDADGNYKFTLTNRDPVFIYCATYRALTRSEEYNVWAVPLDSSERVDLNSSNHF